MNTSRNITAAIVLLALAGVIFWQTQGKIRRLTAEIAALREGAGRLPVARDEQERLAKQLKEAAVLSPADQEELLKLRARVVTTQRMVQQNKRLQAELDQAANPAADPDAMSKMWHDSTFGPGTDTWISTQHAMRWGSAVLDYAKQHQGQFPGGLKDAAAFLNNEGYAARMSPEDKAKTPQTADQFELVYHGTMAAMTNPLPEAAILIRLKQPVRTANGKWARYYIFGNGGGTFRFNDDGNFEEYESIRIPQPIRQ